MHATFSFCAKAHAGPETIDPAFFDLRPSFACAFGARHVRGMDEAATGTW
jgi:hypothetical protein